MTREELVLLDADHYIPLSVLAVALALDTLRDSIDYVALEAALYNEDYNQAERIINAESFDNLLFGIGVATTASFVDLLYASFVKGGQTAIIELLPELQKEVIFDTLGTRAVDTIRTQVAIAAKEATLTLAEGVRQLIDNKAGVLVDVKAQAKAIVDSIGLTKNQAIAISNYRKQLESSKLLGFTNPLNRRIDPLDFTLIQQQMSSGNLAAVDIDRLVKNYRNSLLEKHALDIARTETMAAVNSGRQELWEQAMDQGVLTENDNKYWIVTPDDKLRGTHAAIPKMNPHGVPIRSQFITPFGNVHGPQDRLVELINCRCVLSLNASVTI